MVDFVVSNASRSSHLAGVAWILGFAALFIFFAGVGIFGPINDVISIFQFLFLVPVALALHRILARHSPLLSLSAAAVAIVAMLAIALLQTLLVFRLVRFEQTLRPILILSGVLGLWWLATSIASLVHGALPTSLAWIGIAVGISNVLGAVGFWIGGQEHPLTAASFVAVAVSVPLWCFRVGKLLAVS
jgi:hypothetical protein